MKIVIYSKYTILWQGTRMVPLPSSTHHVRSFHFVRSSLVVLSLFVIVDEYRLNVVNRSKSTPSNNWCRVQFVTRASTFGNTPSIRVIRTPTAILTRLDRWSRPRCPRTARSSAPPRNPTTRPRPPRIARTSEPPRRPAPRTPHPSMSASKPSSPQSSSCKRLTPHIRKGVPRNVERCHSGCR